MKDEELAEEYVMNHAKEAIQEQIPYFKFAEQMFLAGLHADVHTDNSAVIAELEQQIEKMKCCGNCKHNKHCVDEWKAEWNDQVIKANEEGFARTKQTIQLSKAKEIIKKIEKIFYSGENAIKRLSEISDILAEAEQFLNSEVAK